MIFEQLYCRRSSTTPADFRGRMSSVQSDCSSSDCGATTISDDDMAAAVALNFPKNKFSQQGTRLGRMSIAWVCRI